MIFEGYVSQNDRSGALKALQASGISRAELAAANARFDETMELRKAELDERIRATNLQDQTRRDINVENNETRRFLGNLVGKLIPALPPGFVMEGGK